ncbi:DNA-binding transcriptional regulator, HxlR family [Paracoccus isoporae]|uniref:DNA-binding transcriptional regulator, HxlR family n=1 Tax=Paracoccus isoporae TaxID=591205 RepID=A0A1G6YTC7_9RHOB|nr:winged helix-turn-helix transcriptional regulator [Paracoccus isoporae]SDD93590.1 DNA-binding transcriptional regulator, HxlR family [Paracoccus isoporae]
MTKHSDSMRLRYDEGCLASHALNLIGDRWALLVVRELIFAPKRFQMIRKGLPGITPSVLSQRLVQLEQAGVVSHDASLGIYALTQAGQDLLPVLEALCVWAMKMPGHDPTRFISPSALMISMGVNLRADAAAGMDLRAGFDFGAEAFEMQLSDGDLATRAVRTPDAPFILSGTGNTLAFTVYGPATLTEMISQGAASASGDLEAAQKFIDLFRLETPP